VHLEQFGKTLPELSYDADDKEALENLIDEQKALLDVFSVPFPQVGDLVVFSYLGFASHIGVFVGDGKVLHTDRKRFSVLDSLDSPRIRSHIKGYYRVN
jgi:cell wall-associated NlpC family hydrolase